MPARYFITKDVLNMTVEYAAGQDHGAIRLAGELDHHAAVSAIKEVLSLIDENCPGELRLDMKGVSFMDSSGIALILGANRRMIQGGGGMKVVNAPKQAMRVLCSAGLDKVVRIE